MHNTFKLEQVVFSLKDNIQSGFGQIAIGEYIPAPIRSRDNTLKPFGSQDKMGTLPVHTRLLSAFYRLPL